MEYKYLKIEDKKSYAIIFLSRPPVNALSPELLEELENAVLSISKDKEKRAIIIAGEGKSFCAGADIKVMKDFNSIEAREFALKGQNVLQNIENAEIPIIAAIHGYALGGGCELALACDLRVVTKDAQIGQPEVKLGLIPGFAGTQRLSRLIGIGRAKWMIYTGEMISGEKAYEWGFAEVLAEKDKHIEEAEKLVKMILEMGPTAIRLVKSVINRGIDSTFKTATSYEAESFGLVFSTGEPKEGIEAFLEKRKAKWQKED
ncbi:MAG: enoyl-CoA hydratase-related protein [Candidatus Hydrothermales bacterium]